MTRICALALMLAVGMTHLALAMARGQGGVAQTAVICAGQSLLVLHLDDSGAPVMPGHFCPDAALVAGVEAAALPPPAPRTGTTDPAEFVAPMVLTWVARHQNLPPARAPPARIESLS